MKAIHTFVVLAYKESQYLEECIQSVLNQRYKSEVVIATSTPNDFIRQMAAKYDLKVVIKKSNKSGIGPDFDFALHSVHTELVTIAHQDDIYDYDYSSNIVEEYEKHRESIIIFTDYYEIRNGKKVINNRNLKIKSRLLKPLRWAGCSNKRFIKRRVLSLGNPICCPAVTYATSKIGDEEIFDSPFKSNVDWHAWEKLSNKKGDFIYIDKKLMGHRVHNESTTTEIIVDNIRTQEDLKMISMFWPKIIAKCINKLYKNAEQSNEVE